MSSEKKLQPSNESTIQSPLKKVVVSTSKIVVPRIQKEKRPVKAGDIFAVPFSNIFLCAMKQSGKSTVLTNIIFKCIGANTKVIVICSTVDKDPTWIDTIKKLRKKNHDVVTLTEIVDPQNGVNALQEFMDENKGDNEQQSDDDDENEQDFKLPIPKRMMNKPSISSAFPIPATRQRPSLSTVLLPPKPQPPVEKHSPPPSPKAKKTRKLSKIYPEYIICLDDLGDELKNKALTQLMKTNRHYKALVIISSQHLNDLQPAALRQLGYVMLFARFSEDKLLELYQKLDITLPIEKFKELYRDATKDKYSFLFISRAEGKDEFRKGFTERYIVQ